MVLLRDMLKAAVLATMFAGCSSDALQDSSNLRSGDEEKPAPEAEAPEQEKESEETGSDVPADVTALFLSLDCKSVTAVQNLGRYELMCRVTDKTGKFLIPADFSLSYNWKVAGIGFQDSNVSFTETNDTTGYSVNIVIGKTEYVTASILSGLNIKLDYVEKVLNKPGSVSTRLDSIYSGLANQKYIRFTIFSVRDHLNSEPIQFLNKISIKLDGQWLDLTVNEADAALMLGSNTVVTNGSVADAAIILNILGKNSPTLPAGFFSRFNGNAAFDASVPLHLNFGTGKPFSITGLRYNDGQPIASRNIAAGFPDDFQFETSSDNITWIPIKDSRIKIDDINDQDQFDFVWNGSEAK